jgi:hypothetical protein
MIYGTSIGESSLKPVEVRSQLVEALRLDLVGPENGTDLEAEILPQAPSRWYLPGFLVPLEAGEAQKSDETANDDFDSPTAGGDATDDDTTPEPPAARRAFFPSSIGLSLLVSKQTRQLRVEVSWGDYHAEPLDAPVEGEESPSPEVSGRMALRWKREPHRVEMTLKIPAETAKAVEQDVPDSNGLRVAVSVRPVQALGIAEGMVPDGTRSVSVFLVNHRIPGSDELRDERFIFQAGLSVNSGDPLIPRPNLKGHVTQEWDERVADLQYRDVYEYSVGHGIATRSEINAEGICHTARTCWIPSAEVERVAPAKIPNVEIGMDALAELADGPAAQKALGPFVKQYGDWIAGQKTVLPSLTPKRREMADEMLRRAGTAGKRIQAGIDNLSDEKALLAFRMANRVMAKAARRRFGPMQGKEETAVDAPTWRPFQLAFILMNLPGIVDPHHHDREVVDLLFFPTGGGKTEAYLGLAAFTLVYRRLKNPGYASPGLSVLMRYTLRLLTLDQLGRAATLICALELERLKDPDTLGPWPFEIGLWVGRAATPNQMGFKGDNNPYSARSKTIAFQNDDRKPAPIPLENCPWCGEKFKPQSFRVRSAKCIFNRAA